MDGKMTLKIRATDDQRPAATPEVASAGSCVVAFRQFELAEHTNSKSPASRNIGFPGGVLGLNVPLRM
jgi:hypothetical protein